MQHITQTFHNNERSKRVWINLYYDGRTDTYIVNLRDSEGNEIDARARIPETIDYTEEWAGG